LNQLPRITLSGGYNKVANQKLGSGRLKDDEAPTEAIDTNSVRPDHCGGDSKRD